MPIVEAAYFSIILSGVAEALYEQDMRIVLCPTLHQHEREVTLLDRLMHGTTDGAMLTLPEESNNELKALQAPGLPVRRRRPADPARRGDPGRLGRPRDGRPRGDRAPARAGPPPHRRDHRPARLDGEQRAARTATTARWPPPASLPDPALDRRVDFAIDGGDAAAARLLDLPDRPTAIFAFNDNIAIGVMRAARARGLRIPEDLSVVGFDDSEHAGSSPRR